MYDCYDDDRRSNFLTCCMFFCFIAVFCAMINCAIQGEGSNSQPSCYDEVSRAEDIWLDYSCRPGRRLVTEQSGTTTLVKCICDK